MREGILANGGGLVITYSNGSKNFRWKGARKLDGTVAGPLPPPRDSGTRLYDESADGVVQISDAVALAHIQNKRILLQFGANWCVWCHKLHKLFQSDADVSALLKSGYIVVLIDVNGEHNRNLTTKYGAKNLGLPFIVVLDKEGQHLTTKNTADLEEGDHQSPEKVLSFLKRWARE